MAPRVASSVVKTGPKDALMAIDVYAPTPPMIAKGASLSKASDVANNAKNIASKISVKPADLSKIIKFEKGEIGVNQGALDKALWTNTLSNMTKDGVAGKALAAAAGQSLDSVPGMNTEMKIAAEALFPGILSSQTATLLNQAGELVEINEKANPSTAVGLANLAAKLTGNDLLSGYIDQSAALTLAVSVMDKAVALGIPSIIDAIIKKYKADKNLLKKLLSSVRSVIFRSDIPTLNIILDHIKAEGVLAQVPDACTVLLGVYRFPKGTKPKDWPKAKAELLAVLARINPTWDKIDRAGTLIPNLAPFYRISSNAKALLLTDPVYEVSVMVAKSYGPKDINNIARKDFPRMRA